MAIEPQTSNINEKRPEKDFRDIEKNARDAVLRARAIDHATESQYKTPAGSQSYSYSVYRKTYDELADIGRSVPGCLQKLKEALAKKIETTGKELRIAPPNNSRQDLENTLADYKEFSEKLEQMDDFFALFAQLCLEYGERGAALATTDYGEKYDIVTAALESGRVQALQHLIADNMGELNKLMFYCGSDLPEFRTLFGTVINTDAMLENMTSGNLDVPAPGQKKYRGHRFLAFATEPEFDQSDDASVTMRYDDRQNTLLFPHEPCEEDIHQGGLGDCYLLSSFMGILRSDPTIVKDMMKDNGDGTVTVRFYDEDTPVFVTVRKSVPVQEVRNPDGTTEVFDRFSCGPLWVQMIEKAYAASQLAIQDKEQVEGPSVRRLFLQEPNYKQIISGDPMKFLTHIFPKKVPGLSADTELIRTEWESNRNQTNGYTDAENKLFDKIEKGIAKGSVVTCATFTYSIDKKGVFHCKEARNPDIINNLQNKRVNPKNYRTKIRKYSDGLSYSHAYAVMGTQIGEDGKKYVIIRNPHGEIGRSAYNNGLFKVLNAQEAHGYSAIELSSFGRDFGHVEISDYTISMENRKDHAEIIDLQKRYGGVISAISDALAKNDNFWLRHFGSQKQYNALRKSLTALENSLNGHFPNLGVIRKNFRDVFAQAELYHRYRLSDPEWGEKLTKNRSVNRLKAAEALEELGKIYAADNGVTTAPVDMTAITSDVERNFLKEIEGSKVVNDPENGRPALAPDPDEPVR